jgi:(1->4)-alpha-D-glucan 1-alpha-D-glucosylmutase
LLALDALVAAWPLDEERFTAFLRKAAREAKVRTSWTRPAADYEALVRQFTSAALRDPALCGLIEAFVARIDRPAHAISLAWTLLKIASPGVPDLYQGCERHCYLLVDPDNRRPIDRRVLTCGDEKTALVRSALAHRHAHLARFGRGSRYEPLIARGEGADHVIAFLRRSSQGGGATLVVAVRWSTAFARKRKTTHLALPGAFRSALTRGRRVSGVVTLDALLGDASVGLFEEDRA